MPAPRNVIRDITLRPGDAIRNITVSNVTLNTCRVTPALTADDRVVFDNVVVSDIRAEFCRLRAAVIRDCTVENVKLERRTGFIDGCEFDRVTFKGKFNPLVIQMGLGSAAQPPLNANYAQWIQDHDRTSTEWSLDISEATGVVDVRGYRASRMILNPDIHAVVRRENAEEKNLDWIMRSRSLFRFSIGDMQERGWEDVVLIANPHSKSFGEELDAIARLRDEGIADVTPRGPDGRPATT